jgi:hypothetical protein
MALTNASIGQAIKKALRDSADLKAKCIELYGQPHTVYYGSTGRKSPPPEDFPVFTVVPWSKERGEDLNKRIFTYTITLDVDDETITEETSADGIKTLDYQGPASLEILLDLAMAAIRAISSDLTFEEKTFDYEPIEYFPLFVGELLLTATYPFLLGGFEPTLV